MSNRDERCSVVRTAAWASRSLKRVIRAMCFECMGGTYTGVDDCPAVKCPNWPFRLSGTKAESFERAAVQLESEGLMEEAVRARTPSVFSGFSNGVADPDVAPVEDDNEDEELDEPVVDVPIQEPVPAPGVPKFTLSMAPKGKS